MAVLEVFNRNSVIELTVLTILDFGMRKPRHFGVWRLAFGFRCTGTRVLWHWLWLCLGIGVGFGFRIGFGFGFGIDIGIGLPISCYW